MTRRYRVHPLKSALLLHPLVTLICIAMVASAPPWMKILFIGSVLGTWLRAALAYVDVSENEIRIRPHYLTFEGGARQFAWAELTGATVTSAWPRLRSTVEFQSGSRSARVPLFALADPRGFLESVRAHLRRDVAVHQKMTEIAESLR